MPIYSLSNLVANTHPQDHYDLLMSCWAYESQERPTFQELARQLAVLFKPLSAVPVVVEEIGGESVVVASSSPDKSDGLIDMTPPDTESDDWPETKNGYTALGGLGAQVWWGQGEGRRGRSDREVVRIRDGGWVRWHVQGERVSGVRV